MKLKTLKDILEETWGEKNWEIVHTALLKTKTEAIKWVKHEIMDDVIYKWIKNFFNITEEDLK